MDCLCRKRFDLKIVVDAHYAGNMESDQLGTISHLFRFHLASERHYAVRCIHFDIHQAGRLHILRQLCFHFCGNSHVIHLPVW